jgi:HemK-like putative methylase
VESASNDLISGNIERGNVVHHIRNMAARALESDEPLAYILGNQPFGPLSIICRKPTLIPRVETEALVDHIADVVVASLRPSKKDVGTLRILDLCCGTGCIALLLEHKLSEHARRHNAQLKIAAVDWSQAAIELAKENVQVYALASGQSMTSVHKADVFDDQSMSKVAQAFGPFDLVVCNPPYIRQEDWASLDNSVRLWEDRGALVGSLPPGHMLDGLSFYRRLGQLMKRQGFLSALGSNQPPLVAVEVGHHQAQSVCHIFQEACPNASISVWQDQFGVDRGVLIKIV